MPSLHVLDAEPVGPDVIEELEAVLECARNGDISSVAIATVERSGCTNHCWSKAPSVSLLIGSIARMEAALIRHVDCDD